VASALLVTPDGRLEEITVYSVDAIAAILAGSQVDCLSSDDGLIDFWFRTAMSIRRAPNRRATEFLLSAGGFTSTTVPLVYGGVVVCSHDPEGRLWSLTEADRGQLRLCSWPSRWWLGRRFASARRRAHSAVTGTPGGSVSIS
jgi:hypothetical protein